MTQATAAAKKYDIQKLQRAIVDGLEDVKAQDIQVFNTEHLSPLFERVIVASGTSNRQTKALASSVRDAVRDAGFPKPRTEGEQNGEWIIVDCGGAVAHIMQPAIRSYYHLEEIWGDKPVRLRLGAPKPAMPTPAPAAPAKKVSTESIRRSSAAKKAIRAAEQAAKPQPKAKPAGRVPAKAGARAAPAKAPARGAVAKAPPSKAAAGKSVPAKAAPAKAAPAKAAPIKVIRAKAPAKSAKPAPRAGGNGAGRSAGKSTKAPARKASSKK
ncbi:MAG TPA: ribosome silencing factor [Ramlibacter sp.]|nr:ribosome silencing factor [Ramlibacter sp.]